MKQEFTVWFVGGKGQQGVFGQSRLLLVPRGDVQEFLEVHPGSEKVLVPPVHTLVDSYWGADGGAGRGLTVFILHPLWGDTWPEDVK